MKHNIIYKEGNTKQIMRIYRGKRAQVTKSTLLKKGWPKENKKGQVTLFIILAILIVAVAIIFFVFKGPLQTSNLSGGPAFELCVKDAVNQGLSDLSKRAGIIRPEFTYAHLGEDFTYLCYTNEYYKTCTVQQPLIKQKFENELQKYTSERVNTCYQNSLQDLKAQGYEVTSGIITYDVFFEPGIIRITIDAPTTIGAQSFKNFNFKMDSSMYDTVMIATSILQSEAQFGDADTNQLMLYYTDFRIEKLKQGEGTTLYIIKNKLYEHEFKFASRSLAWPPGYL